MTTERRIWRMGKLSKRDMEELRETCSLGCEYSGTEEVVSEIVHWKKWINPE